MARPPAPEPYTCHNIYLYESQLASFRNAARDRQISISQVIRELIEAYLK